MKSISTNKLSLINFIIIGFFSFLYIKNAFQIEYTIIGVFQEMFTIPFMGALDFFWVTACIKSLKRKQHTFCF